MHQHGPLGGDRTAYTPAQPPFGAQPPYGAQPPGFGPPPGGQPPGFGPPGGQPPKRSNVAVVVAAVVAVAALIGGTVFVVTRGDDDSAQTDERDDRDERDDEDEDDDDTTTTEDDDDTTTTDDDDTTTTEDEPDLLLGPPATYDAYELVFDDSGRLSFEVPTDWSDRYTGLLDLGSGTGLPSVQASTDLEGFAGSFTFSGAEVVLLDAPTTLADMTATMLDFCGDSSDVDTFTSDVGFTGEFQVFFDCEGADGVVTEGRILRAVLADDVGNTVFINVNMQVDADFEAADTIMATVFVL